MRLNDDLSVPTRVHAGEMDWTQSPARGVERRMLFRIGEETARATSIVRYAPQSQFPRHGHPGGEEFLVLEGVFQDETGDFPAGTYVRNPPGTAHAPGSRTGCVILVKLWQFRQDDRHRVVRFPGDGETAATGAGAPSTRLLFDAVGERVAITTWAAGADMVLPNPDGLELLVLDGSARDADERLDRWTWLRLPAGTSFRAQAGAEGVRVWSKHAPLLHDDVVRMDMAPTPAS